MTTKASLTPRQSDKIVRIYKDDPRNNKQFLQEHPNYIILNKTKPRSQKKSGHHPVQKHHHQVKSKKHKSPGVKPITHPGPNDTAVNGLYDPDDDELEELDSGIDLEGDDPQDHDDSDLYSQYLFHEAADEMNSPTSDHLTEHPPVAAADYLGHAMPYVLGVPTVTSIRIDPSSFIPQRDAADGSITMKASAYFDEFDDINDYDVIVTHVDSSIAGSINSLPSIVYNEAFYDSLILASAPLAYWKLNESSGTVAIDYSGNGNTASYYGTYSLQKSGPSSQVIPYAASMSSAPTGGYFRAPYMPSLQAAMSSSTAFTVETWVSTTSSAGGILFSDGYYSRGWNLLVEFGAPYQVSFQNVNYFSSILGTKTISDTKWHHVALVTHGNGELLIYVDGSLDVSATGVEFKDIVSSGSYQLTFNEDSINWDYFTGAQDRKFAKAAVYTSALTSAQIEERYTIGHG